MSQKKISELEASTLLTGSESLVVVQSGATKQATLNAVIAKSYRPDGSANYGWDDYLGIPDDNPTAGANTPSWTTFLGGISGLAFSPTTMNQRQFRIHILHDYAVGTALYLHAHWSPLTTNVGTVRWGFEYSVAKGHGQQAFSTPVTVYVQQTTTGVTNMHFVAEIADADAISGSLLETDALIICRVFRDAAHVNDTFTGSAILWNVDAHVRTSQSNTTNKAPPFN